MNPLLTAVLLLALGNGPTADAGTAAESADGAALFVKLQCAVCHSLEKPLPTAPSLRGRFGGETTLRDGTRLPFDERYVRESILTPAAKVAQGFMPLMPSFQGRVSDADLEALVAFLKTLRPEADGSTASSQPVPADR